MSTTVDTGERLIDKTLQINAPAEQVWKALTEPGELVRWFPLQAEVEPGAGGRIWLAWGDYWRGRHDIEIWEPGSHLRTTWPVGNEIGQTPEGDPFDAPTDADGNMAQLTVDYFLEGEGGTCTLRLVHTGFGKGAQWDDWYDGIRRGWDYELECLRHYLENHRGTDRHVAWVRRAIDRSGEAGFDAVFGPDGLLTRGSVTGLAPGDPYSLVAFDGSHVQGRVLVNDAGAQFAGTIDELNNGCFRVESFCHGDSQEINVFIATWDGPEQRVRELESRWQERLQQLYA
jgi:uncharacterized protein YndB with AHSA1/START domain